MRSKQGEHRRDSTEMQTNEDEEERAQSSERPRGKRRTAREIAAMFEQLKQRHIARKKEWENEREELINRVETAEESRRVLADIRIILVNLREELRLEERKRFEMEAVHLDEKCRWEDEKTDLVRRLEESAQESDKDGKAVKQLKEKLVEKSTQLAEWQETIQQLRKQLLEKEDKFLRERRELQLGLEKERSSWRKKEQILIDKLRESNSKSSGSNTSPTNVEVSDIKNIANEDYVAAVRKSSSSSTKELAKYSDFQKTVDDALKQIEKISTELKDIDTRKPQSDRASATPSPGMQLYTPTLNYEQSPSPNAPWRTKRRPSASRHGSGAQALSPDGKSAMSSSSALSESPVDLSISLPSISNTRINQKRSPNPDRKVRKINSQGSQLNVAVSSPDAPTYTAICDDKYFPFANKRADDHQDSKIDLVTQLKLPEDLSKDSSQCSSPYKEGTQNDCTFESMRARSTHDTQALVTPRPGRSLTPKDQENATRRSTSPRLPRLHQQLLFKKEPSLPLDKVLTQRSFETESLVYEDKRKTKKDDPHPARLDYKTNMRRYHSPKREGNNEDFISAPKSLTENMTTDAQAFVEQKKYDTPPVVHPKPKVAIHKDQEGNILRVSPADERNFISPESLPGPEKQYSIAGRMGKAGRDWIRKKLNFRDRKPEEHDNTEKQQLETAEQSKKKSKTKTRHRPSSLLRSIGNQRSLSSSDDSTEAEQEARRESFLRRSRRKAKGISGSGSSNTTSPARRPKKYTRSKTEATSKDMKNFLTRFKASQSNPNKPSVVKQFELKLLENEVKTLNDEQTSIARPRLMQLQPQKISDQATDVQNIEYLSGEEGDAELDPMSPMNGASTYLPKINDDQVTVREKSHNQAKAGPKLHYRRSMTDFRPRPAPHGRPEEQDTSRNKRTASMEAGELCTKKSVSKLVDRFSSNFEDEIVSGAKIPIQSRPGRKSAMVKPAPFFRSSHSISRSNSTSSYDGSSNRKRASVRFETEPIEESEDEQTENISYSWRTKGTSKPVTTTTNESNQAETRAIFTDRNISQSLRASAPPGQYDSLSSFWERERPPPENEEVKPGRMKMMSEEMKRKAHMLEQALTKGPRTPRRYRRADTQPVHSNLLSSSEEDSDTEGVLDVALPSSTRNLDESKELNDNDQSPVKMHHIIPPVTGKFSRPAKPGRLPSRWAR